MADIYTAPEVLDNDLSQPTDTNLSALQYTAVKLDSGELVVAAGAGEQALGILQNAPNGSSKRAIAQVRVLGLSRAKAGGSITFGAWLKADGSGEMVVTTTNLDKCVGMALTSADDGDIFLMLVVPATLSVA